jgi:hypothetical protein
MAYWSFGVMGENRIGEYKPRFRAYRDMIIFSVKVIGQNQTTKVINWLIL